MSALTTTQPAFDGNYLKNIGHAARALLAALLAVKRRRATMDESNDELQFGRSYQDLMPNLANELRFMASRG